MANTRQVILSQVASAPGNSGGFSPLYRAHLTALATENQGDHPWPIACTLSNLGITISPAPGVGNSRIFSVRVNGVNTSLSVTISGTSTTGTDQNAGHNVTLAAGDIVTLNHTTTGTPANIGALTYTVESLATTNNQSGYGVNGVTAMATGTVGYNGPFRGNQVWNPTENLVSNVVAAAGTIDKAYFRLDGTAGAAKSYTFVFVKNGTVQDGTGGTPNTTLQITGAVATAVNGTFSLSVSPGDIISIRCTPAGTPTARRCAFGVGFTATTDGESQYCAYDTGAPTTGTVNYVPISGTNDIWSASENSGPTHLGLSSFTFSGMQLQFNTAPSSGKSRILDLRKNVGAPAGVPTVTIANTATSGSDTTHSMLVVSGDTVLAVRTTPSGTPTAPGRVNWAFIMTSTPPVSGTGAIAFSKPTLAGVGKKWNIGTAAIAFAKPTLAALGKKWVRGTAAIAFAKPTLAAIGKKWVKGNGAIAFAKPVLNGIGTVVAGFTTVTGVAAITFAKPVLNALGVVWRKGIGSITFQKPTLNGTGTYTAPNATADITQIPVEFVFNTSQPIASITQILPEFVTRGDNPTAIITQIVIEIVHAYDGSCEPDEPPGIYTFPVCLDWPSQEVTEGEDTLDPVEPALPVCSDWPSQEVSPGEDTLDPIADLWNECEG